MQPRSPNPASPPASHRASCPPAVLPAASPTTSFSLAEQLIKLERPLNCQGSALLRADLPARGAAPTVRIPLALLPYSQNALLLLLCTVMPLNPTLIPLSAPDARCWYQLAHRLHSGSAKRFADWSQLLGCLGCCCRYQWFL